MFYDEIIPLRQSTRSTNKKAPRMPWITKPLLKSINHKNNLFCKYKRNPNENTKGKYARYRNILTTTLRFAKRRYFTRQFDLYKNDTKSTWKVVNEVLRVKDKSEQVKEISQHGILIQNPVHVANAFNDFFVDLGPSLASNIPVTDKAFHYFLTDPNPQSVFFIPIQEYEVRDVVHKLKTKKSAGNDGITNFLLKNTISTILSPLT